MGVFWNIVRAIFIAAAIVAVAEFSKRSPRYSALLLSLPIITISAFTMSWFRHHDLVVISNFAKETLILMALGLPLFLPLIFCNQLGMGFWASMGFGIVLAFLAMGAWLLFGPSN
jgi:hypothetical protein